jgi:hypothetical protein
MAQFPLKRRTIQRTIWNESADGSVIKLADPAAGALVWELALTGLSDEEIGAMQSLFEQVAGQLMPFTFLDPFDNLVQWSEDLSAAVWTRGPYLSFPATVPGPLNGSTAQAVCNGSQAIQSISQALAVPASLQYAASVYARSDGGGQVTLFANAGGQSFSMPFMIGAAWQRFTFPVTPGGSATQATFGVTLSAGSTIDLFGFQVDAQAGASKYKPTAAQSGVYVNAYFLNDSLVVTAYGVNQSACTLKIRAALG